MEETFIYLENENFDDLLLNKLQNRYKIKEFIFELDVEIVKEIIDTICVIFFKDKNNVKYFKIINECIQYYNNIIIIKTNPFYDHFDIKDFKIKLYDIKNMYSENAINYAFKKCTIKIKENNLKCRYLECFGVYIQSNYFNDISEFKKYFINWTNCNEETYNKWFESYTNDDYLYSHILIIFNSDYENNTTKYIHENNMINE